MKSKKDKEIILWLLSAKRWCGLFLMDITKIQNCPNSDPVSVFSTFKCRSGVPGGISDKYCSQKLPPDFSLKYNFTYLFS